MSLKTLNKTELLKLADRFQLGLTEENTKAEILDSMDIAAITYDMYKEIILGEYPADVEVPSNELAVTEDQKEDHSPVLAEPEKTVLVKMDRNNPSFEAMGLKFTRRHPYAVVSEDVADQLIEAWEGFRLASPSEAKRFYG